MFIESMNDVQNAGRLLIFEREKNFYIRHGIIPGSEKKLRHEFRLVNIQILELKYRTTF